MIKVFFYNKTIFLTKNPLKENNVTKLKYSDDIIIETITNYDKNNLKNINIYGTEENLMLSMLKRHFIFIRAAGGVVKDTKNRILFIYKRNIWDLPKGKIDKGETPEEAAKREVGEECGIDEKKIAVKEVIATMYHIYPEGNDFFLKETLWFEMLYAGDSKVSPQLEEGITKIRWTSREDLKEITEQTYLSLKCLLKKYL